MPGKLVLLICALVALAGCGGVERPAIGHQDITASPSEPGPAGGSSRPGQPGTPSRTIQAPVYKDVAIAPLGPFKGGTTAPDILVVSKDTLSRSTIDKVEKIPGTQVTEPISLGSFYVDENQVNYAAVDPETFRRFTPPGTAETDAVWQRLAGGELAIAPTLGKQLQQQDGYVRLGNESDSPKAHIGAYADILAPLGGHPPRINAVLNYKWAEKLHMKKDNALLIGTGQVAPATIMKALKQAVGSDTEIQTLAYNFDNNVQTAVLTGGSVAEAVGSFTYSANANGSVNVDPRWVASHITTETMPIIGSVTGNRVMLPQLRAALIEIVQRGLADKIYHYDGCFVPRFIANTQTLSFHSFGTAVDLNAADNQRGTAGTMDRTVVSIFNKWGFTWGGTWHYTDPMHFELARLVKVS